MHHTPPADTVFYRVIGPGRRWSDVLSGKGTFYAGQKGSRYNNLGLKTVYAASDPLVSVTEAAFYEALGWHERIGSALLTNQHKLAPFGRASGRLWAFQLNPPPTVIDVEDPQALQTFRYPPHVLRNPTNEWYKPTHDLMNAAVSFPAPTGGPKAWGVKAPSVRTPRLVVAGQPPFQPFQYAFALQPNQQALPGHAVDCWNLEIEFLDSSRQPVTAQTAIVDWRRPRFRLRPRGGNWRGAPVPAFPGRPNATACQPNTWYDLEINFA
jgi:hypothetical protein